MKFNKKELNILTKIVNIGLSKATDSLSFFINNKKVIFKLEKFDIYTNNEIISTKIKDVEENSLLKTMIKGQFTGDSFLLFNKKESEKLTDLNISLSNYNELDKSDIIKNFLLEVDNIITASVLTQFSNILKCNIFGDVPNIFILNGDSVNKFISDNCKGYSVYFNAKFITDIDINPEFIWVMDNEFLKRIIENGTE